MSDALLSWSCRDVRNDARVAEAQATLQVRFHQASRFDRGEWSDRDLIGSARLLRPDDERKEARSVSKTITVDIPDAWGEDKLSAFFDHARGNAFASFVQLRDHYSKLLDVDSAFLLINENLLNPQDFSAPFFLMKSHSSFRAAASLAMTGHSPEAFMVMRGCIESALYGLYLNRNEASFKTYLDRHDDEAARKAVRQEFTIGNMWKCLRAADERLQADAEKVYEKTIDFGAHPNVAALIAATTMSKEDERARFTLAYLTADREVLRGTMKSVAQAGVIALSVFRHIFEERYDLLGLAEKLPELREGL